MTLAGYYSFVVIGWNGVTIPALIRSLEHDFHASDAAFGLFYFVSAALYATGSFSGGLVTERLGRRSVLSTGALLVGTGLAGEALARSWLGLLLAAVVVSLGAGAIDGGVNGLFLALYRTARGGALNLLHLFYSVGALVSPFVVGRLVTAGLSWRVILPIPGVGALILAGLFLFLKGIPSGRHAAHAPREVREAYTRAERSLRPFAGLAVGIGCYVAAEMAVSGWVVKLLAGASVATATGVLSLFWGGLALGRLLSRWAAERVEYTIFTVGCVALSSAALIAAVLAPTVPLAAALFGLTGLFSGPIYPMIVAIGGNIYPRRLAALTGSLGASAVIGSVVYPPLVGVMATHVGLRVGLIGAGFLGVPAAAGIVFARRTASRLDTEASKQESRPA